LRSVCFTEIFTHGLFCHSDRNDAQHRAAEESAFKQDGSIIASQISRLRYAALEMTE